MSKYSVFKQDITTLIVLEDVMNGKNVKENSLLKSTTLLSLILYQDAFEVTYLHKILAVYMCLGEMHPQNPSRSHVVGPNVRRE